MLSNKRRKKKYKRESIIYKRKNQNYKRRSRRHKSKSKKEKSSLQKNDKNTKDKKCRLRKAHTENIQGNAAELHDIWKSKLGDNYIEPHSKTEPPAVRLFHLIKEVPRFYATEI